jgi:hypothetical protein
MTKEAEIRLIAYQIWERDGCCHGRHVKHWLMAEGIYQQNNLARKSARAATNAKGHVGQSGTRTKTQKPTVQISGLRPEAAIRPRDRAAMAAVGPKTLTRAK